jgi:hypothetical protein
VAGVIRWADWGNSSTGSPSSGEHLQRPCPAERVGHDGLHPPPLARLPQRVLDVDDRYLHAGVLPQPHHVQVQRVADLDRDDRRRIAGIGAVEPEHHVGVIRYRPGVHTRQPGFPRGSQASACWVHCPSR